MQRQPDRAFTLVEILIVVVILGILASLVLPQLRSASIEAVKSSVLGQMQTIEIQVGVYRARNQGSMPQIGGLAGTDPMFPAVNDGWGALVSQAYMRQPPFNSYTATRTMVDAPGAAPNMAGGSLAVGASNGWGYRPQNLAVAPPLTVKIFAMGYDPLTNLLSNEAGYTQAIP